MRAIGLTWFLLLAAPAFSGAQDIDWDGRHRMMDIAKMVESLEDPDGQLTIDQVAATEFDTQFVRPNTPILNFGFTNSYHWLRFSVHNTLDEPALLEIAHAS
ncbi:MAG: hypothetical protein JNK89_00655, partial [Saprospiraceae bacterium]|nr:hypothetical protein [Saprospiraceae bacterium]